MEATCCTEQAGNIYIILFFKFSEKSTDIYVLLCMTDSVYNTVKFGLNERSLSVQLGPF